VSDRVLSLPAKAASGALFFSDASGKTAWMVVRFAKTDSWQPSQSLGLALKVNDLG
jgi:hypothetical protein